MVLYVLKKLAKYPSRATDTGTDQRSGVHLLQAIINKINGTCEIADTQAAAVCLGLQILVLKHPAIQPMFCSCGDRCGHRKVRY